MMDTGFLTFSLPFLSCLPAASPLLHCTNFLFKAGSFIPTLVFHWSKKLPLAPGDKHPVAEEDDRPKNFSSSKAGFNDCSPSVLHAASDLSQYWFSLSSRRLEITFSLTFPLRFPICQFLFHILFLSFNTDIYSVSLKACMRYIPVFPYIEEHVESLPRFCCWALNLLNEPPAKASLLILLDLFSMLFFKYQIHTVPALFFLILSFRYSGSWSYKHMIGTFTILAKMSWALCLKRQLEWGIISFGNSWVSIYQCGAFFPPVCSCENSKSSKGYFGLWHYTKYKV